MNPEPELPIPISLVDNKFLIFDIDAIIYLRRVHHICGVMSGTLPQHPSQNIFLGLPMQIMPEEAQLLIEKRVAYLADDARAHDQAIRNYDSARHADYMANVRRKAEQAGKIRSSVKEQQKKAALEKVKSKMSELDKEHEEDSSGQEMPANELLVEDEMTEAASEASTNSSQSIAKATSANHEDDIETGSLLYEPTNTHASQTTSLSSSQATIAPSMPTTNRPLDLPYITPTTSTPLTSSSFQMLTTDTLAMTEHGNTTQTVPNLPSSYPLYRHLNSKQYFSTPGLRFGCQYCVYPGDPLRYHSHFLATSYEWDEEIDLMDIVGGGRLSTGVKKGWLIGGEEIPLQSSTATVEYRDDDRFVKDLGNGTEKEMAGSDGDRRVRTFSVEWAAM